MTFGLPDPDEALREAEQRDLDAERQAERSEELSDKEKRPEPATRDDQDDGEQP